jgi:hypothetical protein
VSFNDKTPRTTTIGYLLWAAGLCGFCGLHRLYVGKKGTGIFYFFTFGGLFIGQLLDLFRIPQMVESYNTRLALGPGSAPGQLPAPKIRTAEDLRKALLRAATENGGSLTVSQGVLATGKSFGDVEKCLEDMAKSGYVGMDTNLESGLITYIFHELAKQPNGRS